MQERGKAQGTLNGDPGVAGRGGQAQDDMTGIGQGGKLCRQAPRLARAAPGGGPQMARAGVEAGNALVDRGGARRHDQPVERQGAAAEQRQPGGAPVDAGHIVQHHLDPGAAQRIQTRPGGFVENAPWPGPEPAGIAFDQCHRIAVLQGQRGGRPGGPATDHHLVPPGRACGADQPCGCGAQQHLREMAAVQGHVRFSNSSASGWIGR